MYFCELFLIAHIKPLIHKKIRQYLTQLLYFIDTYLTKFYVKQYYIPILITLEMIFLHTWND